MARKLEIMLASITLSLGIANSSIASNDNKYLCDDQHFVYTSDDKVDVLFAVIES